MRSSVLTYISCQWCIIIVSTVAQLDTRAACPYINPPNLIHNGSQVSFNLSLMSPTATHPVQKILAPACLANSTLSDSLRFEVYISSAFSVNGVIYSGRFVNPSLNRFSTVTLVGSDGDEKTFSSNEDTDIIYTTFGNWFSPVRIKVMLYGGASVELAAMSYSQTSAPQDCPPNLYCSSASPFVRNRWSACLPADWACNGREECASGIDEKDCCTCSDDSWECVRSDPVCVSSLHSCMRGRSAVDSITMSGCPAARYRQTLTSLRGLLIPPDPRTSLLSVEYTIAVGSPSKLSLTYAQVLVDRQYTLSVNGSLDSYTIGDDGKVEEYFIEAGMAPHIVINMTSSTADYHITYTVTSQARRGAQPCSVDTYTRSCVYPAHPVCFKPAQKCNLFLDCPNGQDEVGCGTPACRKDEIMCPRDLTSKTVQCYTIAERCDGSVQCTDGSDEHNCDDSMCGTHNGTFLCPDKSCIMEQWTCDGLPDCEGGADELGCNRLSRKVITALVIGLLVCGILIVIAAGCACRLYTHRVYESMQSSNRYESPMSLITNELMRRAAPPPYAEALTRSRPFDDVRQEYLAALELEEERARAAARVDARISGAGLAGPPDAELEDTASIASTSIRPSGTGGGDSEPKDDSADEAVSGTGLVADPFTPKSDEEESDQPNSGGGNQVRRRQRTISNGSDVSLLSRESDDVPLLGV